MLEKGKFLEKTNFIVFLFIILFSSSLFSQTTISKIFKYNTSLRNSSALFIQNDGTDIQEGKIFFGEKRIKINYENPQKITLILSEKKGVYINHELEESQYFNTNKSYVSFFFKILNGDKFLEKPTVQENSIELNNSFNISDVNYKIKIVYENNPIKIRKVIVSENDEKLEISFFNHNNLESFEKNFFSMINPYLN